MRPITNKSHLSDSVSESTYPVLLFDSTCEFCSSWVRFVLKYEKTPRLRFASLNSGFATQLLQQYGLNPKVLDSVVLVENNTAYTQSEAILRLTNHLKFPWNTIRYGHWIPQLFRDFAYRLVARNRHRLLVHAAKCPLPTPELSARFIQDHP